MSYVAGTRGLSRYGIPDGAPRFVCDACGATYEIKAPPPVWFLDGKAPRGWRKRGEREHACGRCIKQERSK